MAEGRGIVRFVRAVYDRVAGKKMEQEFEQSLQSAGEKGGEKSGRSFLKELKAAFDKRKAELARDLAAGIIDEKEVKKQTEVAARAFNDGVLRLMDQAKAKGAEGEREFARLGRQIKRIGDDGQRHIGGRLVDALKRAAIAAGALFGLNQIRRFAQESVKAAIESEKSGQRLRAVWEANAGAVQRSFRELRAFVEEVRNTTLFSRDEIELATAQLLTYKSISGETFEDTIRLATDLSSVFGGLTQSTSALARALDDPIRGLGELRKQGFTFEESVQRQIKALVEQNRLFDAQRIIIDVLSDEVGGVAEKMRTGWVGAVDRYSKSWEDLREAFGNFLLDQTGGISVLDRVTNTLDAVRNNMHEVAAAIRAVFTATVLLVGVRGLLALRTAFVAANAAAVTFTATLRGMLVLVGPKGWLILGISALSTALFAAGRAARQAAADAREAMRELEEAHAGVVDAIGFRTSQQARAFADAAKQAVEDTKAQIAALEEQKAALQTDRVQAAGLGVAGIADTAAALKAADATRALNDQIESLNKQLHAQETVAGAAAEKVRMLARAEADAAGVVSEADAKRLETFQQRRAALIQEIADTRALAAVQEGGAEVIRQLQDRLKDEADFRSLSRDMTVEQAAELRTLIDRRREELDAQREAEEARTRDQTQARILGDMAREIDVLGRRALAVMQGEEAVEALNRQLFIEEAVLRSGAEAGSEFESQVVALAGAHYDAAQAVESAWLTAFDNIEQEGTRVSEVVGMLLSSLSSGGIASIARYAKAKVIENIAAAAENFAKSMGWIALGNVASAGAATTAAKMHLGAAAKWGLAASAAAAVGGGGGSTAAVGGTAPPSAAAGARSEPRGELHVHFVGPGFKAINPEVQKVVQGALQNAQQITGPNATVRVYRDG